MKKTFFLAIALGLLMSLPGYAQSSQTDKAQLRTDTLNVPEMQCGMCESKVEKALTGIEGVASAEADSKADRVIVSYEASTVTREELIAAITATGYATEGKKANKKAQAALSPCCRPGGH